MRTPILRRSSTERRLGNAFIACLSLFCDVKLNVATPFTMGWKRPVDQYW